MSQTTFSWTKPLIEAAYFEIKGMATDLSGNIYICGYLYDTSPGITRAFVGKYDPYGNQSWYWEYQTEVHNLFYDIAVDRLGQVFVCGVSDGDQGNTTNPNAYISLIAQYDENGPVWLERIESNQNNSATCIVIDASDSGHLFICGNCRGELQTGAASGGLDSFIAKYTKDGKQSWLKQFGSTVNEFVKSLASDAEGNVFICGDTKGTLTGNDNKGEFDVFIAKYKGDGEEDWTRQLASTEDETTYSITTGPNGEIFVCGGTLGSLNPGQVVKGSVDAFLACYEATGAERWVKMLGSENLEIATCVRADHSGNVFVGGYIDGSLKTGQESEKYAIIAKFDAAGEQLWFIKEERKDIIDEPAFISLDQDGTAHFLFGRINKDTGYPFMEKWTIEPGSDLATIAPIQVDALFLDKESLVAPPKVDFSRLPFFDGTEDVNAGVPYIGEEFQAIPFQNSENNLEKGVHLHWALPNALTKSFSSRIFSLKTLTKTLLEGHPDFKKPTINNTNEKTNQYRLQLLSHKILNELESIGAVKPITDDYYSVLLDPYMLKRKILSGNSPLAKKEIELIYPILSASTVFPMVPDRWLINRYKNGKPERSFILECNYKNPHDLEDVSNSTAYPIGYGKAGQAPFCYLGKVNEFKNQDQLDDYLNKPYLFDEDNYLREQPLTAIGYGEPTFAAYYPNCRGVFGFYDNVFENVTEHAEQPQPTDFFYTLYGYHSVEKNNFLHVYLADFINRLPQITNSDSKIKQILDRLDQFFKEELGLDLDLSFLNKKVEEYLKSKGLAFSDDIKLKQLSDPSGMFKMLKTQLPDRIYFYNKIVPSAPIEKLITADDISFAVGNTGTEALSAYFNKEVVDQKVGAFPGITLEELLESIQFAARLDHLTTDSLARFQELRHAKGFKSIQGGLRWTIRSESGAEGAASAPSVSEQVTLPDHLAGLLHELNGLQLAYDRKTWEIESRSNQLYADWSKYMLSKYPPEVMETEYPDVDQLRFLMQSTGLDKLEVLNKEVEDLKTELDDKYRELRLELFKQQQFIASDILDWDGLQKGLKAKNLLPVKPTQNEVLTLLNNWLVNSSIPRQLPPAKLPKAAQKIQDLYKNGSGDWNTEDRLRFNRIMLEAAFPQLAKRPNYLLQTKGGMRFNAPDDPVLLLKSPALPKNTRHQNTDLLPAIVQPIKETSQIRNANIPTEWDSFGSPNQMNPLILDWLVEYYPIETNTGQDIQEKKYPKDYLKANYQLDENSPDLRKTIPGHEEGGHSFWGSTVLSEHAGDQLTSSLSVYVGNQIEKRWGQQTKLAKGEDPLPEDDIRSFLDLLYRHPSMQAEVWDEVKKPTNEDEYFPFLLKNLKRLFSYFYYWYTQNFGDIETRLDNSAMEDSISEEEENWKWSFEIPAFLYYQIVREARHSSYLSQSLGGFHQALLMRRSGYQLSLEDPLGYEEYQAFDRKVAKAVGAQKHASTFPLNAFFPIRAGALNLTDIRILDTFGREIVRLRDLANQKPAVAETLKASKGEAYHCTLPPRFVQPARLDFRWLSAVSDALDLNDHPASSPICGWVVLNELDRNLMIYAQDGTALGYIDKERKWRVFPGQPGPVLTAGIENSHLRKMVRWLCAETGPQTDNFWKDLQAHLNDALDNIEPDQADYHEGTAQLMSQPLALVRAKVQLELMGEAAQNQGWKALRDQLRHLIEAGEYQEQTLDFEKVQVPFRLGEHHQLNDGLVAFWVEKEDGSYLNEKYYTPLDEDQAQLSIPAEGSNAITGSGITFSMLMDPRGVLHLTTGVLPVATLEIPPDQYADALKSIEVVFLTAPLLTQKGFIRVNLPEESGYAWSWIEKDPGGWSERTTAGHLTIRALEKEFDSQAGKIWNILLQNKFLQLIDEEEALITLGNTDKKLEDLLPDLAPKVEFYLRSRKINPFQATAAFQGSQEIREGWLKLKPVKNATKK